MFTKFKNLPLSIFSIRLPLSAYSNTFDLYCNEIYSAKKISGYFENTKINNTTVFLTDLSNEELRTICFDTLKTLDLETTNISVRIFFWGQYPVHEKIINTVTIPLDGNWESIKNVEKESSFNSFPDVLKLKYINIIRAIFKDDTDFANFAKNFNNYLAEQIQRCQSS